MLGTLLNWLSKTDPTFVIPIVIGGVTWLYREVRGQTKADNSSIIDSVFETFAHELLDVYTGKEDLASYLKTARETMTSKIWMVLSKRGLPRNALTEKLVNMGIEKWSAWLASQLLTIRSASKDAPLSEGLK